MSKDHLNLSRRGFLGGLAATISAPYVVRSGILMPVKKILTPIVRTIRQVSWDGANWQTIGSLIGREGGIPIMLPLYANAPHHRILIERDWRAGSPAMMSSSRYASMVHA